jgi:L-seryl-tRNA(Ser) seleniumtransferase
MKVGKEEIIGCLTAIETWLKLDSKKLYEEWQARVDRIAKLVETVPGVAAEIYVPDDGNRYPTLRVNWDQDAWGFSVSECVRKLHDGDPMIEVLSIDNPSMVSAVEEGQTKPNEGAQRANHLELVSMTAQPMRTG